MSIFAKHRTRLIGLGLLLLLAVQIVFEPLPLSGTRFPKQRRQLSLLRRYIMRPEAKPDRPFAYEGEDIWIETSLPAHANFEYYRPFRVQNFPIAAALRIFGNRRELTDSIFISQPSDMGGFVPFRQRSGDPPSVSLVSSSMRPGDSVRCRVNRLCHLLPGKYRGFLDAGAMSHYSRFRVIPIPDSLKHLWNYHVKLGGLPSRQVSSSQAYVALRPRSKAYMDSVRQYARLLVSLPTGTPLRMEGLRLCAREFPFPYPAGVYYQEGDSALFRDVLQQYAREPRFELGALIWALQRICGEDWNVESVLQLAEKWRDQAIMKAVQQWEQEEIENRGRRAGR